jgi:hypothetical protein
LLTFMDRRSFLLIVFLIVFPALVSAQSAAAVQKVNELFTPEQLADMQEHTHYKYVGLVLYHSSSFLVSDKAGLRSATEEEITAIDLLQYAQARRAAERVIVHDVVLDKDLVLLGRDEFEALVMDRLNEADRIAYLAYKSASLSDQESKTR